MRLFSLLAISIFVFVTIGLGYFNSENNHIHEIRDPVAVVIDGSYIDTGLHAPKSGPEVDFEFHAENTAIRKIPYTPCLRTCASSIVVSNVHKLIFLIHLEAREPLESPKMTCRRDVAPRGNGLQTLKACFRPKADKPPSDPRRIHGVLECKVLHSGPSRFGPSSHDCHDLVTCIRRRVQKIPDREVDHIYLQMCRMICRCETSFQ